MLLELFFGFLKIGLFSFGGAYGAIPLIREAVLQYGWLDDEKLSYMIAVSESTPGPIMVNMATYIGNSQAGIAGALIATVAVVLPAFLIVIILLALLKGFVKNPKVHTVLSSVKACVIGIVLATGLFMIITNCFGNVMKISFDLTAIIITVILFAIYYSAKRVKKNGISPITLICVSAVIGVLVYGWK